MSKRISRQQRLDWLRDNPSVWERFPAPDIGNHHKVLFQAMQSAGLYHPKTEWFTCDIDGLVSDARKLRAQKQAAHIHRCKGCGFAIHPSCDYCGECMCEEDSL